MNFDNFYSDAAVLVAVCLYSTHHWIGGTVAVLLAVAKLKNH